MSRLLDARTRAHQVIANADEILAEAARRRSRIDWLTNLVRSGHPLPDTPEGQAETASIYERIDREEQRPTRPTGSVEWDGIWRRH